MIENIIRKYFSSKHPNKDKGKLYDYIIDHQDEFLDHFDEAEWNALCNQESLPQQDEEDVHSIRSIASAKFSIKKVVAAAAVIALILTAGYFFIRPGQPQKTIIAQTGVRPFTEVFNKNNSEKTIVLPDSSVILLKPNSVVKYYNDYNQSGRRDIYLEGEALFKVHKDVTRRFSVFCDSTVTIALGTEFIVSNSSRKKVIVRLLSGKIVVSKAIINRDDQKYYLTAGNSILYDIASQRFTANYDNNENAAGVSKNAYHAPVEMKEPATGNEDDAAVSPAAAINKAPGKRFSNQSLEYVLEYLSHKYHTNIQYPTKDISNITFIGTIHPDESIQSILKNIALMNDFKIDFDSSGNTYTIR
ncbi:FecR family protein [Parafilimonas sp.]|uniref:FecR family protein n=1 Tax=Parafilimonas sp. TaxID=1969739 RepID=UPI0039E5B519